MLSLQAKAMKKAADNKHPDILQHTGAAYRQPDYMEIGTQTCRQIHIGRLAKVEMEEQRALASELKDIFTQNPHNSGIIESKIVI